MSSPSSRLSVMTSRLIAANGMLYDGCEHLLTEGVLLPATDTQVRRDIDGLLTKHAQRELPPEKPKKEPKPPKEKKPRAPRKAKPPVPDVPQG